MERVRTFPLCSFIFNNALYEYSYWSKLDGDGNITWGPDALLTPTGEAQAADARTAWKQELTHGAPLPTVFLSSPLRRALDTWKITFVESPEREKPVLNFERRKTLIYEVNHFGFVI